MKRCSNATPTIENFDLSIYSRIKSEYTRAKRSFESLAKQIKTYGELVEVSFGEICLKMKGTNYPTASRVALRFDTVFRMINLTQGGNFVRKEKPIKSFEFLNIQKKTDF